MVAFVDVFIAVLLSRLASIFSLSVFAALPDGERSCEPTPPAKNLTHFFFRLKQISSDALVTLLRNHSLIGVI